MPSPRARRRPRRPSSGGRRASGPASPGPAIAGCGRSGPAGSVFTQASRTPIAASSGNPSARVTQGAVTRIRRAAGSPGTWCRRRCGRRPPAASDSGRTSAAVADRAASAPAACRPTARRRPATARPCRPSPAASRGRRRCRPGVPRGTSFERGGRHRVDGELVAEQQPRGRVVQHRPQPPVGQDVPGAGLLVEDQRAGLAPGGRAARGDDGHHREPGDHAARPPASR